jgi:hypothetical protein
MGSILRGGFEMRKLTTVVVATVGLGLFASGVSAGTVWYIDQIHDHATAEKVAITERYEEKSQQLGEVVYRDLKHKINTEKERISNEAYAYLDKRVSEEAEKRANFKSDKIYEQADREIAELKRYIDELIEEDAQ